MEFLKKLIPIHEQENIGLLGMTDEFFCAYIDNLYNDCNRDIVIVTATLYEANKLYTSLKTYNDNVLFFPMDDFLTSESIATSPELKTTRLDTLRIILSEKRKIIVCHLESLLRFLPTPNKIKNSIISLNVNSVILREDLINNLLSIGYSKESIVTNTGEIGIRGFVIDIFPLNSDYPVRIEFFDDQIESIKLFNAETQKSIRTIDSIEIFPNTEFLPDIVPSEDHFFQKYLPKYSKNISNILEYFDNPLVVLKDKKQIFSLFNNKILEMKEYKDIKDSSYTGQYMFNLMSYDFKNSILYNTIDNIFDNIPKNRIYNFNVKKVPEFHENIDKINAYIDLSLSKGKTIVICLDTHKKNSFSKYINSKYIITNENEIFDNKLNIIKFSLNEGFEYGNYIFISSKELFNKTPEIKYKTRYKYSSKIKSISNLEIGDYVVHSVYGIAVYNGIKTLSKQGLLKDYLELLYAGTDKLYIPVEKIELIGKFTGKEGIVPKINKLGSSEWEKNKLRVKNRVHDIAQKLLELYAKRKAKPGFAFSKDDELQVMFESEFEFAETPDQLRAIEQIKHDMELSEPMDRLVCGDVGYGKTEVAFRAMFKAVNNSKQVLYLCPTTILSNQQYTSALKRFSSFPVRIELLNRFTPNKKVKEIINDVNDGKVDILFGTHRILSNEIKPKNLGLLIVDEEQRFGVLHKEKIKEYKENIDVLTLTATPIPRTLQMSLVGMRSLSLIETPPVNRFPVQTYVVEENNILVRNAIYKEMGRGGQVFVLYNNVKHIEEKVREIESLVPDAKVVYTHGQLNKSEIENKMYDFINKKYDVMVCTTIIETGIDINNVNTLIIYNADQFGLSQLYQIRGRVGRSNKIAYAYLMYKKDKVLTETAVKRLQAIKEFTELGSGFSIASRDLAIRGAGDILGDEQAGFIDSVGIDLYLKILNQEVEKLKGNEVCEDETIIKPNLLEVETHISDFYVSDEDLKIEIHKLINKIDSYDSLISIKNEIEDRFGKVSESIEIYMYEEWFESMAKALNITKVIQSDKFVELVFDEEQLKNIDSEQLFMNALSISRNFSFNYKNKQLKIKLDLNGLEKHYIYYFTDLLESLSN